MAQRNTGRRSTLEVLKAEKEAPAVLRRDIASMRSTIEFLKAEKEVLVARGEVDPIYEISGIQKALEGGPAILFENIKGYPHARNIGNVFARDDRTAKILGVAEPREIKFQILNAIKKPIPPRVVEKAPCQEVVLTRNIDVSGTLPVIKHSEKDADRILGGGNSFLCGRHFRGGTNITFNRMRFRGKDWATFQAGPGSHLEKVFTVEFRDERIPMTINIGTPPAVALVAGGGMIHSIVPAGSDEAAIAGGIQGFPLEICKAKTVDAYSIAQSEWVLEGYIDSSERVWETEEAEKIGRPGEAPFFPEWTGYMGTAYRAFKFQVTAITHRKDRPIFYTPLAHSFEGLRLSQYMREACFYEIADQVAPGLVVDAHISPSLKSLSSVIYQVKKRRVRDEGMQANVIAAALVASPGMRMVIVVDADVDIYSDSDIMWALGSRLNPATGIVRGASRRGYYAMPAERAGAGVTRGLADFAFEGGIGLDATVPFGLERLFTKAKYPVDRVDLKKWFSASEIAQAQSIQSEYARLLARTGQ